MHFWAAWCEPCKFLDTVLAQLVADTPRVTVLRVEAEEAADISEQYSVSVVPYFLFFRDGKVVDSLEGADAATLTTKFSSLAGLSANGGAGSAPAAAAPAAPSYVQPAAAVGNLQQRLKQLVSQKPVMLFMKVRCIGGCCARGCLHTCCCIPPPVPCTAESVRPAVQAACPCICRVCGCVRE